MDTNSLEIQRAKDLDLMLTATGKSRGITYRQLEQETGINQTRLGKLTTQEKDVFDLIHSPMNVPSKVYLTGYGKELFDSGFSFTMKLQQEEQVKLQEEKEKEKENKKKSRNSFVGMIIKFLGWIVAAIIGLWAAWASDNTKLHDQKEFTWEQDKKAMHSQMDVMRSQIDSMTKQLNAIPDSVKQKYLPKD